MTFPEVAPGLTSPYTGYKLESCTIVFMVLGIFFVSLRMISRYVAHRGFGVDDVLIIPALVCYLGQGTSLLLMVSYAGAGYHIAWLEKNYPEVLVTFTKLQIAETVLYSASVAFPKLSMLALYLRIFIAKRERVTAYVVMGIVTASFLVVSLCTVLICIPLGYKWNPQGHPGGHCLNAGILWRYGTFPNIITDFIMLVLPWPCIWSLQLTQRDKTGLALTFVTGSIGLVTSIVRQVFFWNINGQTDGTWAAVQLGQVNFAEPGVYLIAACLPTYRSLFRRARDENRLRHRGTTWNIWGFRKNTGIELSYMPSIPSRYVVKTMSNGFQELGDKEVTSQKNIVNSNSPGAHKTIFNPREDLEYGKLGDNIRVQKEFIVETESK